MGLGVCKSGDVYKVGFASKQEWIKRARSGPSARLSSSSTPSIRIEMWGVKAASDKKMLQAEPPHNRNTCRISLAPTPPEQGMGVRQRELVAPFLALKLSLIIMGKGVGRAQGMGLEQDKPRKENRDRPKECTGT